MSRFAFSKGMIRGRCYAQVTMPLASSCVVVYYHDPFMRPSTSRSLSLVHHDTSFLPAVALPPNNTSSVRFGRAEAVTRVRPVSGVPTIRPHLNQAGTGLAQQQSELLQNGDEWGKKTRTAYRRPRHHRRMKNGNVAINLGDDYNRNSQRERRERNRGNRYGRSRRSSSRKRRDVYGTRRSDLQRKGDTSPSSHEEKQNEYFDSDGDEEKIETPPGRTRHRIRFPNDLARPTRTAWRRHGSSSSPATPTSSPSRRHKFRHRERDIGRGKAFGMSTTESSSARASTEYDTAEDNDSCSRPSRRRQRRYGADKHTRRRQDVSLTCRFRSRSRSLRRAGSRSIPQLRSRGSTHSRSSTHRTRSFSTNLTPSSSDACSSTRPSKLNQHREHIEQNSRLPSRRSWTFTPYFKERQGRRRDRTLARSSHVEERKGSVSLASASVSASESESESESATTSDSESDLASSESPCSRSSLHRQKYRGRDRTNARHRRDSSFSLDRHCRRRYRRRRSHRRKSGRDRRGSGSGGGDVWKEAGIDGVWRGFLAVSKRVPGGKFTPTERKGIGRKNRMAVERVRLQRERER